MPFIRSPLRIHRNLDRPPNELRGLRGSLSPFPGMVRGSRKVVHGIVCRNSVRAKPLSKTNGHHPGSRTFHERSVGGYGGHEDREGHVDLCDDVVCETVVAHIV